MQHPELAFQETRTAGIAAEWLTALGYEAASGVGGTGVVGAPAQRARARRFCCAPTWTACPSTEATGLAYASQARGRIRRRL